MKVKEKAAFFRLINGSNVNAANEGMQALRLDT